MSDLENAKYLKVSAAVRYWDDAEINGDSDESGVNVPFKNGDMWEPVIDLAHGFILNWPAGVTAKFHFKVCDAGSYYLYDASMNELARIEQNYVPSGLCHGDRGFGDYIIFNVDAAGKIDRYSCGIEAEDWQDNED